MAVTSVPVGSALPTAAGRADVAEQLPLLRVELLPAERAPMEEAFELLELRRDIHTGDGGRWHVEATTALLVHLHLRVDEVLDLLGFADVREPRRPVLPA